MTESKRCRFASGCRAAAVIYLFLATWGQSTAQQASEKQALDALRENGADVFEGEDDKLAVYFTERAVERDALKPFQHLPDVFAIIFRDTELANDSLDFLKDTRVSVLLFVHCELSQAHVETIGRLGSLKSIEIMRCDLSDLSLQPFSNLKSLKALTFTDSSVPANALKMLQAALPDCSVSQRQL